jgi:hypothetical protein
MGLESETSHAKVHSAFGCHAFLFARALGPTRPLGQGMIPELLFMMHESICGRCLDERSARCLAFDAAIDINSVLGAHKLFDGKRKRVVSKSQHVPRKTLRGGGFVTPLCICPHASSAGQLTG